MLTTDKGVTMVVMDKDDYIRKVESLLAHPAYRTIDRDPTSKIKAKLVSTLRRTSLVCLQPPRNWLRFVDDTFVIHQQAHVQAFLDHINSIDPAIKFTVEGNQGNGPIPFLDTLVTPKAENSLSITVYHKPTHTDQYLQWDCHHNLSTKYSVIGTLIHRGQNSFYQTRALPEGITKPQGSLSQVQMSQLGH